MENKDFRKALQEAAMWETEATEYERTKISYAECRESVLKRVFEKYKDKLE